MESRRRFGAGNPILRTTGKSFVSALLSLCLLTLGMDVPFAVGAVAPNAVPAKDKKPKQDAALKGLPITELSADEAILHALNRLAYGPRPGDVERVRQMGLAKWVDQQLNPNSTDDRAVEARLENYPTLRMSTSKLLAEYPQPKQAQKQALTAQAEQRRSEAAAGVIAKDISSKEEQTSQGQMRTSEAGASAAAGASQSMADDPNAAAPMKEEPSAQMNPATRGAGKRDLLGGGDPNAVPRAIADDSKRPQRVVEELAMAKVARAIYSERQLQQIMDDFWYAT